MEIDIEKELAVCSEVFFQAEGLRVSTITDTVTVPSLLASNGSVSRKCCSSHVFRLPESTSRFPEQHERDVDTHKKLYAEYRAVSGTATFQAGFERMTKVLTASTPSAMKIKVSLLAPNASAVRKW